MRLVGHDLLKGRKPFSYDLPAHFAGVHSHTRAFRVLIPRLTPAKPISSLLTMCTTYKLNQGAGLYIPCGVEEHHVDSLGS